MPKQATWSNDGLVVRFGPRTADDQNIQTVTAVEGLEKEVRIVLNAANSGMYATTTGNLTPGNGEGWVQAAVIPANSVITGVHIRVVTTLTGNSVSNATAALYNASTGAYISTVGTAAGGVTGGTHANNSRTTYVTANDALIGVSCTTGTATAGVTEIVINYRVP